MYSANDLQEIHKLLEAALNNFTNATVPPEDIDLFQTIANIDIYLATILRDSLCMYTDTGDPDIPLSDAEYKQVLITWLERHMQLLEYNIERQAYDEKHFYEIV